ncbi:winged helix-turn-helix domain-containing protein [Rubellimicrobium roseum]|uniref:Tetratricopeptide repeat protein n=1 Tax=Rubellimicrobium roseum TaxID=687525 RepID=A0A5C4NK56_9RHOB|nr:winged helix-turn-helix domain-containing protein [Rubellimicrobium roseum]TNC73778.1 tetratricopeptide repeat protein [Rubellimicrobium roseum]
MDLGGVVLDERGNLRNAAGAPVPLRAQSLKVLLVLAGRPGQVVSKDEIFAAVWGAVHVTDDSLTQCVADIRRAIGDRGHRVVQTVPKRGYRLVPPSVPDPEPLQPPPAPEAAPVVAASAPKRARPAWIGGAALAALVAVGTLGWSWGGRGGTLPTLAVMPFEDLSGDPRWERLGRGIAADLAADLSRGGNVVVAAPEAEARYRLDGTLTAEAGALRIVARLTDEAEGRVLWSDRWTGPAESVFAVQDEILRRVGGQMDGTWTGLIARAEMVGGGTRDLGAYELYLRGAEAKHRFTPEGYVEAVGHFRQAIAADPGFVKAHVSLAIVLMFQVLGAPTEAEARALLDEARVAAERAVALDPEDPDALVQLASARVGQGRRAEARAALERAVELAPNNPDVLTVAAWTYPWADGPGLDWARRAMELHPAPPGYFQVGLALAALLAGELELARRAARAAPPVPEALAVRGAAEALAGDLVASRAAFADFAAQTSFRRLGLYYGTPDFVADPAWAPFVEGARRAGVLSGRRGLAWN